MPFQKGQSGNPGGRPKARPFKDALNMEIRERGEDLKSLRTIAGKLLEKAEEGDTQAAAFVADRLDGKPVTTLSMELETPLSEMDSATAYGTIMDNIANGQITAQEGQQLTAIIDSRIKAIEMAELLDRVKKLEAKK